MRLLPLFAKIRLSIAQARPGALLAVLVIAMLPLAVPARSFAQVPTFNSVIMTPTGSAPWQPPRAAAGGDFNADGKLDAVIVDGSNVVRYLRGNGNGTFARTDLGVPLTTANVVGMNPGLYSYLPNSVGRFDLVRAADVNGDGKLDAVLLMVTHINWNPYSFSTVLINTGNDPGGVPQFTATHYALNFYDVRSLTVGDLNGDAQSDYIVGSAYSGLYVHLNNGSGGFAISQVTNVQPSAGNPAVGPGVIADLNGDGRADFIVTSGQAQSTNIFFGTGSGTLQTPPAIIPGAFSAIAVADMNNDAKPDLVGGFGDGSVSVALNNGNGTFGSPLSYTTVAGGNVSGFFVADANGDGNLDVAASLASAARIAILPGNGDGTFDTPGLFGGIPLPMDVTLADFTGDGKADIASVSANGYGGQNYAVLTNTTVFAAPTQLFFTDALTGPSSPNLAAIPAGKYGYSASGLQRTQSSGTTDRPIVSTALGAYLTASNFTAEVTVKLVNIDLLYFGLGQGDMDPTYFNEPNHTFYFRVHSGWQGNYGIQADARSSSVFAVNQVGSYALGSTITLRIVRAGDTVTMSIVGGGSVSYSISAFPSLGLTNSNTRVFFGNSTVGSVFSDLKIYETSPVLDTTTTVSFGTGPFVYTGSAFTATATVSPSGEATIVYSGDCTNAGTTCTATATYAGDATHLGSSDTASITIDPAPTTTTVSFSQPSYVYTGSAIVATASAGATITYSGSCTDVGTCTATATNPGDANHFESSASASAAITPASSTTTVTFGAGPFVYTGSAFTATATVSPSGTATIAYSGDCVNGGTTCSATATYAGDLNHFGSSETASIAITYAVCSGSSGGGPAKQSGSTIPVKIRACNAQGQNIGSSSLPVKAISLSPAGSLNDSGKANAGNLFRLTEGSTYMFNLSTKGLSSGNYVLNYAIGNDPTVYQYAFGIK